MGLLATFDSPKCAHCWCEDLAVGERMGHLPLCVKAQKIQLLRKPYALTATWIYLQEQLFDECLSALHCMKCVIGTCT